MIQARTLALWNRLNFTVDFDKERFIGKEALIKRELKGVNKVRVGIKLIERGIPREGCKLYKGGGEVDRK